MTWISPSDMFVVCIERDTTSPDRSNLDVFNAREPVYVASTEEFARHEVKRIVETHSLLKSDRLVIIRFVMDADERQERAVFDANGEQY